MQESKSCALPLGYSPVKRAVIRHRPSRTVVLRVLTVASYSYNFFFGGEELTTFFSDSIVICEKTTIKRLNAYISPIFLRQNHLNISQAYKSAIFFKLIKKYQKSKIIGLAVQLPFYWVCNCQSSDAPMGKTNLLRIYFLTSSFVPRTVLLLS